MSERPDHKRAKETAKLWAPRPEPMDAIMEMGHNLARCYEEKCESEASARAYLRGLIDAKGNRRQDIAWAAEVFLDATEQELVDE